MALDCKIIKKLLLVLLLCGFAAGCEQSYEPVFEHETSTAPDGIAAWVDEFPIPVRTVQLEAIAQGLATPDKPLGADSKEFSDILDQLIDQRLLAAEAQRRGLDSSPEAQHRLSSARQHIMGNLLLEQLRADNVDENALRKMYEAQRELIQQGKEVRFAHILLGSRLEAEQIIKQLDSGDDFSMLAQRVSLDNDSAHLGGDLGYIRVDAAPIGMRQFLRQLPIGEIGGPVRGKHGWHVLKITDRRTESVPEFEYLRPKITKFLTLREIDRELNRLLRMARINRIKPINRIKSSFPYSETGENGENDKAPDKETPNEKIPVHVQTAPLAKPDRALLKSVIAIPAMAPTLRPESR